MISLEKSKRHCFEVNNMSTTSGTSKEIAFDFTIRFTTRRKIIVHKTFLCQLLLI